MNEFDVICVSLVVTQVERCRVCGDSFRNFMKK